jgi:hypothetical protein
MFELHLDPTPSDPASVSPTVVERVQAMLPDIANRLAMEAFRHIRQEAGRRLKSSKRIYIENLTVQEESPGTWVVELLPPARWIEDGRPQGSMVDDFLNGPGKVKYGPNGRYKIIPFHHNRPPSQMTESQNYIRTSIYEDLFKQHGIPWGNPSQIAERDRAEGFTDGWDTKYGNPQGPNMTPAQRRMTTTPLGKLPAFDGPPRVPVGTPWGSNGGAAITKGAGNPMGHGPLGQPVQGPTGIPWTQGLKQYKNEIKTTHGELVTQKDVMTFRVVSEKHKEEGRWMHPGFEGKKFFDPAYQHIKNQWESEIKPKLEAALNKE